MIEKEKSRVDAFSDGIFAIAITLLILEIKVPLLAATANSAMLWQALWHEWPSFLAFSISFAAILIMWVNHHGVFTLMQNIDRRLLFANGLLLFLITFIPYPTAILASYFNKPAAGAATMFYCSTYVLICAAYNYLFYAATKNKILLKNHITTAQVRKIRLAYGTAFPIYLAAAILAYFQPIAGLTICSSLWILWALLKYEID